MNTIGEIIEAISPTIEARIREAGNRGATHGNIEGWVARLASEYRFGGQSVKIIAGMTARKLQREGVIRRWDNGHVTRYAIKAAQ